MVQADWALSAKHYAILFMELGLPYPKPAMAPDLRLGYDHWRGLCLLIVKSSPPVLIHRTI